MKKIYFLLSAVAISFGSYAQLSLTKAANEPTVGDLKPVKGFDSVGVVPKATGAGLNWNFSAFTQNTVNTITSFTTPGSVAQSSLFAGCTVVENTPSGDMNFWKASSSPTFELLGIYNAAAGIEFNMTANSVVTAVWPINFGYNMTDVGSGTVSALSNTGTITQTLTMAGTGSGTVVIPGNVTYTNILQTKSTQTMMAVIPSLQYTINVVGTTYSYYSSTQKFPLVTVMYEKQTLTSPFGPTVNTTGVIEMNSLVITTGINEVNFDADFTMYPNPAKDNISVNLSNTNNDKGSVEIYNELGQVARRIELGNDATIKTSISVADLKPGVYLVKTSLGTRTTAKKLIIQ